MRASTAQIVCSGRVRERAKRAIASSETKCMAEHTLAQKPSSFLAAFFGLAALFLPIISTGVARVTAERDTPADGEVNAFAQPTRARRATRKRRAMFYRKSQKDYSWITDSCEGDQ